MTRSRAALAHVTNIDNLIYDISHDYMSTCGILFGVSGLLFLFLFLVLMIYVCIMITQLSHLSHDYSS